MLIMRPLLNSRTSTVSGDASRPHTWKPMCTPSRTAYWVSGASIPVAVYRSANGLRAPDAARLARPAHQASGQFSGGLAVLERHDAVLDRLRIPRGPLQQAAAPGRQVGL